MADYIPRPYVPDNRTMLDLMRLASAERSESARQQQALRTQSTLNIGQLIAGALRSFQEDREARQANAVLLAKQEEERAFKRRDQQLREAELESRVNEQALMRQERETAARERAAAALGQRGSQVVEDMGGYGPLAESDVDAVMASPAGGRVRYAFGPGTADGPEVQPSRQQQEALTMRQKLESMGYSFGPNGQVIPPQKPDAPPRPVSVPDGGRLVDPATGRVIYSAPPKREPVGSRQPVWIVGPDGQFKDLAGVAPPGSKPANSREQGRAVTSGDAGRIADLDTSLDDLAVLSNTLQETKDATGVTAQIGASLWKPITDITGWGTDAKKRQGVIDRVKQVIGKALEGGVLRKEDEVKYAKILPTIGDAPEVAASKLEGLRKALIQRRVTTLDALEDGGYDVSKFRARERGTPRSDDPVDALIKKYGGGD